LVVVVLDIEMQGVRQLKDSGIDVRYVFIRAPSFEVLEERLRARGTEGEEDVQRRLAQVRVELEYAEEGAYDKIIVRRIRSLKCLFWLRDSINNQQNAIPKT
jgi:guanylate kinase